MLKSYGIALLACWSMTILSETKSLTIKTNYFPMPDTETIHYDPKITTNHDLFIQISDATGIPPQEMQVDLGAGFFLPQNKELIGKTQFFMRDKAGKIVVIASLKL